MARQNTNSGPTGPTGATPAGGARRGKAVTLRDIAQRTGFSVNTVSHALKGKGDISPATRKRICQTAQQMGYIGNASASFLRSGVSKTVAILVGDISNPHFSIMVKELEAALQQQGYVAFVLNTGEDARQEREAIVAALQKNVDGVILCPAPSGEDNVRFLQQKRVPFVLAGRYFEDAPCDYVACDDEQGGYLAMRHLLALGHRRILFVNGPQGISSAREREAGCRRALAESAVLGAQFAVKTVPVTLGDGQELAKALGLDGGIADYTAVIAFSDMLAWEVIYLLGQRGVQVPQQVSVLGFDNIQSRFLFPVPLTTVSSSKYTLAQMAAGRLLDLLQGRAPGSGERLAVRLIERGTTAHPPAGE